jgi:hypothetical protein
MKKNYKKTWYVLIDQADMHNFQNQKFMWQGIVDQVHIPIV